MYNVNRVFHYFVMILLASAFLVACRAKTPASLNDTSTPGISLNITSNICPSVIVTVRDQITWVNEDQNVHLIQINSSDGKRVFETGDLQPGDTTSFTFSQAGNYIYFCSSDQISTGTITVEP
jgi:plastocyanin